MPDPNPKLVQISQRLASTGTVRFVEILTVLWKGGAQTRHYSDAPWDQEFAGLAAQGVTGIEARFERKDWFADIPRTTEISDDTVALRFWDRDKAVTTLYHAPNSGEGTRILIRQYFPDEDYLTEIFWGYLKAPKSSEGIWFAIEAATGLRSPNITVPRRSITSGCQAIFAGILDPEGNYYFDTQEKIDLGDCPYNLHIGGTVGKLNPETGQPYTFCPRSRPADCSDRIPTPPPLPYLGFDVALESNIIGGGGRTFVATTKANDNILRQPVTVAYGRRWLKDVKLLAFAPESGETNPEKGFVRTLWAITEGLIGGLEGAPSDLNNGSAGGPTPPNPGTSNTWSGFVINSKWIPVKHCHFGGSWGGKRQAKTDFSANVLNYSGTSVLRANHGQIDSRNMTARDLEGRASGWWKKDIRVYTGPGYGDYTLKWTDNRAWCLLDMLTARRYGFGYDIRLFVIQDWIDLAAYCDQSVASIGENEAPTFVRRTHFNAQIDETKGGEFLKNACGPGYFSLPYHHKGKIRITPLETTVPGDAPVFTDEGEARNIIFDRDNTSSLRYTEESQGKIPNEIKLTYDDERYQNMEVPFQLNDYDAQLQAGRAAGDNTFRPLSKEFSSFGMTKFEMVARYARRLLDLGEFEEGGTQNNFKVSFRTWSPLPATDDLHPYSLVRVVSSTINWMTDSGGTPYEVFRVTKMRRLKNLEMEIEAQLYPVGYVSSFLQWKPAPQVQNPGGSREAPPVETTVTGVVGVPGAVKFTPEVKP